MLQVYKDPYCRRHYASVISFPFLFRTSGYILCAIMAYIMAYGLGDMWVKRKTAGAQPDVSFAYRALAHFSVRPTGFKIKLLPFYKTHLRCALLP
jgi:transmembrane protein 231